MTRSELANRRKVLKTIGVGVLSGVTVTGRVSGEPGRRSGDDNGNLVSQVASNGHYAYFPHDESTWGRTQNPFDIRQEGMRWMAEPSGGGIRCRVENLPIPFRNAGFDVHLGSLGSVGKVTVTSKTVQSEGGGPALLVAALYLDVNDNGEFFAWTDASGNTEDWDGFGGDTERGLVRSASGNFTIDDDTVLPVFAPGAPPTLGDIKKGAISGVDGETPAALYFAVASPGGESAGTEEIVVKSMTVERV